MNALMQNCARCNAWLPDTILNTGAPAHCPECGAEAQSHVFPALNQSTAGSAGETVLVEGESGCFYHDNKKAERICDSCGRFMCALCDLPMGSRHICPVCLENYAKKGAPEFETGGTRYDDVALSLVIVPLLLQGPFWCVPVVLVTAPIAIFLSLKFWNKPQSVLPRGRWRFVVAMALGSLEIAAYLALMVLVFYGMFSDFTSGGY